MIIANIRTYSYDFYTFIMVVVGDFVLILEDLCNFINFCYSCRFWVIFIVLSIILSKSCDMTCIHDSLIDTLPKEFFYSLCSRFGERDWNREIFLHSNWKINFSYDSPISEEVEELFIENFAIDNLFIDVKEVGSLVYDAIKSHDNIPYDYFSLIH